MEHAKSSIVGHGEQQELNTAAVAFVEVLMGQALNLYTGFKDWPPEAQHACLITMGLQQLLCPESFGAQTLSLDHAAYATGVALGSMTGNVPNEAVSAYLKHMGTGFAVGRREAFVARDAFKTVGGPQ